MQKNQSHSPLVAGVELGGTKCVCTLARSPDDVLKQVRIATTTPSETFSGLHRVLAAWHKDYEVEALGIGAFGPLDLNPSSPSYGRILETAKRGWSGAAVLGELARDFRGPVKINTDVNAAALAEICWGAGRGLSDFAYVTVGTGIGVGLVVDGRTPRGFGHCELGHIRIPATPAQKKESVCPFHCDCVEGLASGPAILQRFDGIPMRDVRSDDPVWNEVAEHLGVLCHAILCSSAPHRIVFGGGVLMGQPHLIDRIRSVVSASINNYLQLPDPEQLIAMADLGAQAGPMGTIALGLTALDDISETSQPNFRTSQNA